MIQNFRKSIGGFNREDVVSYIEFINNRHNTQLNQLKAELKTVREELEIARQDTAAKTELEAVRAQLEAALAEKAEADALRAQITALKAELETRASGELEAYRRAERVERNAKERVTQIYVQVNASLEQVAGTSEAAAEQIAQVVDSFSTQIAEMQAALEQSKQSIRTVADTVKAIRPAEVDC